MQLPERKILSLELATAIAQAAKRDAAAKGHTIVVAVVDAGGYLVYFEREDGVAHGTVQVAILKAQSSAAFGSPSKAFENAVDEGLFGLVGLPGMAPYEGAVPIIIDGYTLGAIAVSGVTKEIDGEIAQAAVDAVPEILKG